MIALSEEQYRVLKTKQGKDALYKLKYFKEGVGQSKMNLDFELIMYFCRWGWIDANGLLTQKGYAAIATIERR